MASSGRNLPLPFNKHFNTKRLEPGAKYKLTSSKSKFQKMQALSILSTSCFFRNRKATVHRSPVPGTEPPRLVLWPQGTVMGHLHLRGNTEPLVVEGRTKLQTE